MKLPVVSLILVPERTCPCPWIGRIRQREPRMTLESCKAWELVRNMFLKRRGGYVVLEMYGIRARGTPSQLCPTKRSEVGSNDQRTEPCRTLEGTALPDPPTTPEGGAPACLLFLPSHPGSVLSSRRCRHMFRSSGGSDLHRTRIFSICCWRRAASPSARCPSQRCSAFAASTSPSPT